MCSKTGGAASSCWAPGVRRVFGGRGCFGCATTGRFLTVAKTSFGKNAFLTPLTSTDRPELDTGTLQELVTPLESQTRVLFNGIGLGSFNVVPARLRRETPRARFCRFPDTFSG